MSRELQILYRYKGDNGHALNSMEIYSTCPFVFNDPFDCRIPLDVNSLSEDEKDEYVNRIILKTTNKVTEFESFLITTFVTNRDIILKRFQKEIVYKLMFKLGVTCFTQNCANLLMWSYYASSHSGYCIGYDYKVVKEYLEPLFEDYVDYKKVFPKIKPPLFLRDNNFEILKATTLVKSQDWKHEDEYRMVKLFDEHKLYKAEERKIVLPKEAFKELIFGAHMLPKKRSELIQITKEKMPHIKYFEAQPSRMEYNMKVVPVSIINNPNFNG